MRLSIFFFPTHPGEKPTILLSRDKVLFTGLSNEWMETAALPALEVQHQVYPVGEASRNWES